MSTQLGGLRLLGPRRASTPSPGITPRNIGSAGISFHINPNLQGISYLLILRLFCLGFFFFSVGICPSDNATKDRRSWDNVQLPDLVWANRSTKESGRSASGGGRPAQPPCTIYSQLSPSTLIRSYFTGKNNCRMST